MGSARVPNPQPKAASWPLAALPPCPMTDINRRQPPRSEHAAAVCSMPHRRPPGADCESCAARMHMAVESWHCPVCGWRWTITATPDNRIEALGTHTSASRIAAVDITRLAAAEPSAGQTAPHRHTRTGTAP